MNDDASAIGLLGALRTSFDESFTKPLPTRAATGEMVLGVSAGGQPYAVRVREAGGLHRARRVLPVTSPMPALLGIAGRRGSTVAVYDTAVLLGGKKLVAPAWWILAAGAEVVFAFESFDGQWDLPRGSLAASSEAGETAVGSRVRCGATDRLLLRIPMLTAIVRARAAALLGERVP